MYQYEYKNLHKLDNRQVDHSTKRTVRTSINWSNYQLVYFLTRFFSAGKSGCSLDSANDTKVRLFRLFETIDAIRFVLAS